MGACLAQTAAGVSDAGADSGGFAAASAARCSLTCWLIFAKSCSRATNASTTSGSNARMMTEVLHQVVGLGQHPV